MKMTKEVKAAAEALLDTVNVDSVDARYGTENDGSVVSEALGEITGAETPAGVAYALDGLKNGEFLALCDWAEALTELIKAEKARRAGYFAA